MKQYNLRTPNTITLTCCLLVYILAALSCRKENAVEPSNLDMNYFVIKDNPDDPIDHAIYQFYKTTGLACFYKDSIYKKQISKENEAPARYAYVKLSLNYSPFGDRGIIYQQPLSSRNNIPGLLDLIQQEVLPQLPSYQVIPSILLIDTFTFRYPLFDTQIAHGWTATYGFNTVGIIVKDVKTMNHAERKMYAASILAGIAEKKINDQKVLQLQTDFLSITRAATKTLMPAVDIYSGLPFMYLLPPDKVPAPKSIGLLFHTSFALNGIPLVNMPREADDIRAYLTAAFYYTQQQFTDLYPDETLLLKKLNIIRNFAKDVGFKLPD